MTRDRWIDIPSAKDQSEKGPLDGDDQCLVCNRFLHASKATMVHMSTSGMLIPYDCDEAPEGEVNPDGSPGQGQGLFPVGSRCARRIPRDYHH